MKFTVAAATAVVFALAATTASAGVVISQEVVRTDTTGEHKAEETVMIQGHKRKEIAGDQNVITDLDAGERYFINTTRKLISPMAFPPSGMYERILAREGISVELKKTGGTHKVAGYDCQDYAGSTIIASSNVSLTECVASAAAGAREFVEFRKAMVQKLEGLPLQPKGEIPDGIPVSSTVSWVLLPATPPKGFPPEMVAQLKAAAAKNKPITTRTTVSKIEVKEIPADTFVPPADYNKAEIPEPQLIPPPRAPAPH
jgi:hypothetical protein